MAELGRWEPADVGEAAALFREFPGPWWIAGGHAIELALGRRIRDHADIDLGLLRADHLAARDVLVGWELWVADPPGHLRYWPPGEVLAPGVHDVWCRPAPTAPWRIQIMVDESDGPDWVSRRDPGLRRPLAHVVHRTAAGVPFLAPEVQLYYKARNPRPKDLLDLHAVLPALPPAALGWLRAVLVRLDPRHRWLPLLSVEAPRP